MLEESNAVMVASANWVPGSWGGRGLVPPCVDEKYDDFSISDEALPSANAHHQPAVSAGELLHIGIDDSDEEMEPFDAERFVDRLVEDDPPPWRCDGSIEGGAAAAAAAAHLWEAPRAAETPTGVNASLGVCGASAAAAKLFLQPIYNWPPPPPLGVPAQGVDGQGRRDMPIVVPHDPVLDALFTPGRISSPEIVPTVTLGLVRLPPSLGSGSRGNNNANARITKFEPAAIYNIPPPADTYAPAVRVPMAPLRPRPCDRFYLPSSSSYGAKNVQSAAAAAPQQQQFDGFTCINTIGTYKERSNNFLDTSGTGSAAAERLTGADAFSDEYDDDRHAFLRQQEVAHFVGPRYLAGPGRQGLVMPSERAGVVDWVSGLHEAAPAASGGGPPLSLETLFLAVNLVDRFLSTAEGARTAFAGEPALKVAGAACLALASKYEDTQPTSLWGVAVAASSSPNGDQGAGSGGGSGGVDGNNGGGKSSGGGNNGDVRVARKEVAAMELRVASALGFRLTVPTAMSFLGMYLRRAGALGYLPEGALSESVREEAQQILLCVLRDGSSLEHQPSMLAAAALYWASCVTAAGTAPPSSFAFFAVTGYQLDRLCRCLRDMESVRTGGGGLLGVSAGGGDWAGAVFSEDVGGSFFGAGGGHPAITAL